MPPIDWINEYSQKILFQPPNPDRSGRRHEHHRFGLFFQKGSTRASELSGARHSPLYRYDLRRIDQKKEGGLVRPPCSWNSGNPARFLIITPVFRSFRQLLIIIFTFPLGIIGVAALIWITDTNLNIQFIMGIIMMVGISVSYGNSLVDWINSLVSEGQSTSDAIINGSLDCFRPLLRQHLPPFSAYFRLLGLQPEEEQTIHLQLRQSEERLWPHCSRLTSFQYSIL